MKFHLPSFIMGCAVGAGGAMLAPRIRPLVLELFTGVIKLGDAGSARVTRMREDAQDLWAEAKARARGWRGSGRPTWEPEPEPEPEPAPITGGAPAQA